MITGGTRTDKFSSESHSSSHLDEPKCDELVSSEEEISLEGLKVSSEELEKDWEHHVSDRTNH